MSKRKWWTKQLTILFIYEVSDLDFYSPNIFPIGDTFILF